MHFRQLCRKFFDENMKNSAKKQTNWKKDPFFRENVFSRRRCYGNVIAILEIVPKNFESKVRIGFAQSPKTLRKAFCFKDICFNPKGFFGHKKFKFDDFLKVATEGLERSTLKSYNWWGFRQFFKTIVPSICSAGGKSAILTVLPNICRHNSGIGWWIEKQILTIKVLPRKEPPARRVQFCKPCLRNLSQRWSWINRDTKRT